jgi:prepilin peptidase CpaA
VAGRRRRAVGHPIGATLLLAGLLLIATITDVRERKVYNWTTYPGIVLALIANGIATMWGLDLESPLNDRLGMVGLPESLGGCGGVGFIMLACFVFFPGGVGGGDVKLLAMIGAFLGPWRGLEVLLWTFVLSACMAIVILVWRVGAAGLLAWAFRRVVLLVRFRVWMPVPSEQREQWKTDVFLSPAALAAVMIVQLSYSDGYGGWVM